MDGVLTCKTYRLKKCYHYEHSWKETLSATHVGVYDVYMTYQDTCIKTESVIITSQMWLYNQHCRCLVRFCSATT